jgi:hypothetical protein
MNFFFAPKNGSALKNKESSEHTQKDNKKPDTPAKDVKTKTNEKVTEKDENSKNSGDAQTHNEDNFFSGVENSIMKEKLEFFHSNLYKLLVDNDQSPVKMIPELILNDPFEFIIQYKWPSFSRDDILCNTLNIKLIYEFWRSFMSKNMGLQITSIYVNQIGLIVKIDKSIEFDLSASMDINNSQFMKSSVNISNTTPKRSLIIDENNEEDDRRRVDMNLSKSVQLKKKSDEIEKNRILNKPHYDFKKKAERSPVQQQDMRKSIKLIKPTENVDALLKQSSNLSKDGYNFFEKSFDFY